MAAGGENHVSSTMGHVVRPTKQATVEWLDMHNMMNLSYERLWADTESGFRHLKKKQRNNRHGCESLTI